MATADSADQRRANRRLAVDEAYNKLEEYKIKRSRVVFIANEEKRQGGYGIVRKARLHPSYLHKLLGRSAQLQVVAVKEIKLSAMHDAYDLKRAFTKEVLVWSRVKGHPGVAKFLGFCADFDRKEAWLISPWEPFGNVSEFMKGRKLEVPEKLSLAYDTIDALAFLHQLDPPVCHGDIKSPNVLVNQEYRAVFCDFGLARLYEDSGFGRLESTAMTKGSIRWCSPELLEGQPRTASSDIYAWAWLVWEIMTGELPYGEAGAEYVIMRKIFESPLPQVNGESRLRDCLRVWELMRRCWSAEPLQRPTSEMCKITVEYLPHCPPTPTTADPDARSAALLESLGELESWKGNHKTGFSYLDEALRSYERDGNDEGIASVLRKQAVVASRDSNPIKAMDTASAALAKYRSLKDNVGVAESLFRIGWSFLMEDKREDALRNLQESLNIFRAEGRSVNVAKCLERLGELYRRRGSTAEALSTLEEAVKIASGCGDRLGEARALIVLGITHQGLDRGDQAISSFQKARDIAKDIGWEQGLTTSLCRLGIIRLKQGSHAEAEELLRESVRVARNGDAGWRLGQALYYSGKCFRAQGRVDEAVSTLEESCGVYKHLASDFEPIYAKAAALLASLKSTLGHQEEALTWYDKSIAEYQQGGNAFKGEDKYKGEISKCLAAKDAILANMSGRDAGAATLENSS